MKTAKKRIGAVLVAACLMLSIFPTTAFALSGSSTSSGTTTVQYTPAASYVIDIPASIAFSGDDTGKITISCSKNFVPISSSVVVRINTESTLASDGNFYLINDSDGSTKLRCSLIISDTGEVTATNNEVFRCAGRETGGESDIYVQVSGTPTEAGTYSGIIYFTAAVE